MFFLRLVEYTVIAIVVLFGITQVLVPFFKDQPLFPILRKSDVTAAKARLAEAEEDLEVAHIDREADRTTKRVDKVRPSAPQS